MVKKLKNKRKKFSVGGFTGASTADIKQNKLGSFPVYADQLTAYINPPKNKLVVKKVK